MYKEVGRSYDFFTLRGSWSLRIKRTGGSAFSYEDETFSVRFGIAELVVAVDELSEERRIKAAEVKDLRRQLREAKWLLKSGKIKQGDAWFQRRERWHKSALKEFRDLHYAVTETECLLARAKMEAREAAFMEAAEACLTAVQLSILRERRRQQYALLRPNMAALREEFLQWMAEMDVVQDNLLKVSGELGKLQNKIERLPKDAPCSSCSELRRRERIFLEQKARMNTKKEEMLPKLRILREEIKGWNIEHFLDTAHGLFASEIITAIISTVLEGHPDMNYMNKEP